MQRLLPSLGPVLLTLLLPLWGCGGEVEQELSGVAPTLAGGGSLEDPPVPSSTRPAAPAASELVPIPAGVHRPLYPGKDEPDQLPVAAFQLERQPVTNAQFLDFVRSNPTWRRSRVPALFADGSYLGHWAGDLELDPRLLDAPVTRISWFAAQASADWRGRRLPTLAEWEYAAAASETAAFGREEPDYHRRILDWYAQRTPEVLPPVAGGRANHYGVHDLHGLVWEWVDDFNTALVTGESRGDAGLDRGLFCGSGSIGAADPSDYAAFMRFAFRSSLEASYCVNNLSFRCAADAASAIED